MKRFLLAAALCAAAATASAQFEGVADFTLTMRGGDQMTSQSTGRMYMAHGAYRSEWVMHMPGMEKGRQGGKGAPAAITTTILATTADPDKVTMIDEDKKTYSIMDMKEVRESVKNLPKETYTVQKLGGDRVGGIPCQKALVHSAGGDRDFEVCVAKDFLVSSDWLSQFDRGARGPGSWVQALRNAGLEGFPVRWAMRSEGSAEPTMVMELTRFEKKSVPASLFQVPPGYTLTDRAGEARKKMKDAMARMTPEQRKAYEDAMKKYGQPTPRP